MKTQRAIFGLAISGFVIVFSLHARISFAQNQQGNVQFHVTFPVCFDNADNDGDTRIDYPNDPGCEDRADSDEADPVFPIEPGDPIAPPSIPIEEPAKEAKNTIKDTKVYKVLDEKVINNPTVEKVNVTIAAPVIVAVAAANTAAAVATTGVTFASLFTYLQGFVTQPLLLFTRRRRKQWGMVYSSLTKLPVDLAVVRLVEGNTNRLIQTRVTDKEGRYLFFADPGTYRIKVVKPGYAFPSQYLKDKTSDLELTDLYLGGLITVNARTALTRPIPVDPQEKAETPRDIRSAARKRTIGKTVAYCGPVFAMVSLAITPTLTTGTLLALQFLLLGVFKRLAVGTKPKTWATVKDADTGAVIPFAIARIFDASYNKLLETQITDKSGRYAFLVGRGNFYITVDKPGYAPYRSGAIDLTKPGSEEVVKKDIQLHQTLVT